MSSTLVRSCSASPPCSDQPPARGLRRVLFVDHPTVPGGVHQRRHVYERLLDYARRHPERQLRLRPSQRLGERGLPRMLHHPESLLADVELPVNVGITHAPMAELLVDTDLLLSISAGPCAAALRAGCRVALLDVGADEPGAADVATSGLRRSFEQIAVDDLGTPDPAWLAEAAHGAASQPPAPYGWRRLAAMLTG